MAAQHKKEQAKKRGGSTEFIFIDAEQAEGLGLGELIASNELAPDESFEHRWARDLLARGLMKLEAEYVEKDQTSLFETVSPLISDTPRGAIAEAAAKLETTENAIRIALHRMKKSYQAFIRDEVRLTLEPGADVEEELRYLAKVAARRKKS